MAGMLVLSGGTDITMQKLKWEMNENDIICSIYV